MAIVHEITCDGDCDDYFPLGGKSMIEAVHAGWVRDGEDWLCPECAKARAEEPVGGSCERCGGQGACASEWGPEADMIRCPVCHPETAPIRDTP